MRAATAARDLGKFTARELNEKIKDASINTTHLYCRELVLSGLAEECGKVAFGKCKRAMVFEWKGMK